MAKKKKFMYSDVLYHLNKANNYDEEYELDYFSGSMLEEVEPKPYDDYYAIVRYGANEGIYADFYVERENGRETFRIGCAKQLVESNEEYIKMHELAAKVCLKLRMVVYD